MKHKVAELDGALLDAAVALALTDADGTPGLLAQYSRYWEDGGPIIERERISVEAMDDDWEAAMPVESWPWPHNGHRTPGIAGPTPLIAAMRAFVASRLGDEVELP